MAFSTVEANAILDGWTGSIMSLHTGDPSPTGDQNEVVGGSYARQSVTFAAASNKVNASDAPVAFTGMPAVTITHFCIRETGGAPRTVSILATSNTLTDGDTVTFDAGQVTNTLT